MQSLRIILKSYLFYLNVTQRNTRIIARLFVMSRPFYVSISLCFLQAEAVISFIPTWFMILVQLYLDQEKNPVHAELCCTKLNFDQLISFSLNAF